jgi:hypothetical protein
MYIYSELTFDKELKKKLGLGNEIVYIVYISTCMRLFYIYTCMQEDKRIRIIQAQTGVEIYSDFYQSWSK